MSVGKIRCPACSSTATTAGGGRYRCNDCDEIFEVNELPDESRASSRARNHRSDRSGRSAGRSRTASKGSRAPLIAALIAFGAFGLLGLGIAGYFVFKKEPPKENEVVQNDPTARPRPEPPGVVPLGGNAPPKTEDPKKEEPPKPKLQTPEEVVRRVKDATVYIRTTLPPNRIGTGSGFFAGRPGFVVTNAHVVGYGPRDVRPPSKVEVIIDSGEASEQTLSAKVYGVDVESDLALLRVEVKVEGMRLPTPLPFGKAEELVETQEVVIYGYPFGELLGKNVSVNRSSVSSLRKEDGKLRLIQLAGGLNPGNSGGPVTNAKGEVIGVSVAKLQGAETIGFAIPAEEADLFVKGQHNAGGRFETGNLVVVGPNPVRPPIKPPVKPPVDPPVQPQPAAAGKEVKLPGAATAVVVGGSGRFVCLHIPSTRQVAVFDANEGKVVKYFPVGGNKVLIAAGAEKLFVVLPDDNVIQRWDLKTFEKEVTASLAVKGTVKNVLMGSAATGPLWLSGTEGLAAIDPQTLKSIELKTDEKGRAPGVGDGARVSADGKTIGTWRFGVSPSGQTVITLNDTTLKTNYQHNSVGHVAPGPDGRVIHTAVGRFTPEGKSIGERDGENGHAPQGKAYSFPATQGTSLYLNVTFDRGLPGQRRGAVLAIHWASDGGKLADLSDIPVGEFNHWDREAIGNDQRYMLLPANKSLVVFPESNDRLVIYPFDLDAILDKSGKNYLLVDSPPGAVAVRGQAFAHNLTIKSKKGGVKVKVESGPEGLTVSNDGKVSWTVPKDFADNEMSVILTVSDTSGQESLLSLRLAVRGEKGVSVVVAPKDPPAVPPKNDDPAVPPKEIAAAPKNEVVTVKLPGAANAVTVGAGGKYIILNLPQQKQLAVLDVALGKVVKYIPTAEATVFIAAGQDHLFIANPAAKVIQRYSLKTFEKEATVQQPIDGVVAGLCIGSGSKGPLLICPKDGKVVLVDPIKMKAIPGSDKIGGAAAPFVRASADGRLFGWRNGAGGEGHEMTLLEVVDGVPKPRSFWAETSLLLPSPDGRYVYCGEGVFNSQFKKLYPTDGKNRFDRPFLPAASGNLFMQLEVTEKLGRVNFFLPGQYRPFASIDKVDGLTSESYNYGNVGDPIMHDARVHLCPDAGRLVVIPMTNDKLVLHPFNLEDLLKKSDTDYLLVTSEPPFDVGRGTQFTYAPVVRSRKGGVKVKLDSGPKGMKLVDGRLAWRVPTDFTDKEVDVILTISDVTGQEVFQTFKLAVRDRKPDEKEVPEPANPPMPDPKDDKPGGKQDPPVEAVKPIDLTLRPAALQKDEQTVALPSAAASVVPAAGGRMLLIHLPKERKLAVFDTAEAKIVKYLPVAEDEAKFAAGREKFVVLLPGANVIQRWNLSTLEREVSVANPIGSPVKSLVMGSGSVGPLIVTTKSAPDASGSPTLLLFNPKTFKKSEYTFGKDARVFFHPQYPPEVRVSANGELITAWVRGLSPSGVHIWSREGNTYKGAHHHDSWGALLPDPDGRTVFAPGKVATADGKKLNDAPKGTVVPAVQGPLVLSLDGSDPFGRGEKKLLRASVHIDRDSRALITLPELSGLTANDQGLDQRLFLIPDAKLLAILSDSGDKLVLHRFDLDALLEKSEVDYLFVTSRGPASAVRGEAFRYDVQVKSRKGGVKFTLDAAPKGMSVDAKGAITWSVPKDFDGEPVSVILTVSDKSGQETIHSFTVTLQAAGEKP